MSVAFELPYTSRIRIRIRKRFGLIFCGCRDPLDRTMAEVRRLPGVRKVSMSPWAGQAREIAAIGAEHGCPLELILQDLSTVRHAASAAAPLRLARIAMQVAQG